MIYNYTIQEHEVIVTILNQTIKLIQVNNRHSNHTVLSPRHSQLSLEGTKVQHGLVLGTISDLIQYTI